MHGTSQARRPVTKRRTITPLFFVEAGFFEVERALDAAEDVVGDGAVVSEFYQHGALGGDGLTAQLAFGGAEEAAAVEGLYGAAVGRGGLCGGFGRGGGLGA